MENELERVRDEWLILSARSGDQSALGTLVERWHPRLVRHAARVIGTADGAQDVVQEAWISIVRGLQRLDDPARFPGWAFQIVTRRGIDKLRRTRRERSKTPANTVEHVVDSHALSPDHSAENNEAVNALRQAIRSLPADRRTLLSMYYLDSLTINEISVALAIPEGTVKSQLFHTRQELKEILSRVIA